VTQPVLMKCVS